MSHDFEVRKTESSKTSIELYSDNERGFGINAGGPHQLFYSALGAIDLDYGTRVS